MLVGSQIRFETDEDDRYTLAKVIHFGEPLEIGGGRGKERGEGRVSVEVLILQTGKNVDDSAPYLEYWPG